MYNNLVGYLKLQGFRVKQYFFTFTNDFIR